jgi:hypothetical protein
MRPRRKRASSSSSRRSSGIRSRGGYRPACTCSLRPRRSSRPTSGVSWDHHVPDPSELPSPAREVLTKNLETVLAGGCEFISIAQAHEVAQAMERAGLIEPHDVRDGIAFNMPGLDAVNPSFFHARPALPHESTCD